MSTAPDILPDEFAPATGPANAPEAITAHPDLWPNWVCKAGRVCSVHGSELLAAVEELKWRRELPDYGWLWLWVSHLAVMEEAGSTRQYWAWTAEYGDGQHGYNVTAEKRGRANSALEATLAAQNAARQISRRHNKCAFLLPQYQPE